MTTVSRRGFFGLTAAGAALAAGGRTLADKVAAPGLSSITREAQPIGPEEHGARLARVQGLMQQQKIAAFLIDCALDGLMLIFADYEEGLRVAGREILPGLRP